jgi:hypothetical protein
LLDSRPMPLRRNRFAAWLAALAVALHGFWPALAQAQSSAPSIFATICSVDGAKTVDLSGGKPPADGGAGKHKKHCALCVAGNDRLQALAPAPAEFVLSAAVAAAPPGAQPAAFLFSAPASPAQPRAPPVRI